jgi:hypothetical protein
MIYAEIGVVSMFAALEPGDVFLWAGDLKAPRICCKAEQSLGDSLVRPWCAVLSSASDGENQPRLLAPEHIGESAVFLLKHARFSIASDPQEGSREEPIPPAGIVVLAKASAWLSVLANGTPVLLDVHTGRIASEPPRGPIMFASSWVVTRSNSDDPAVLASFTAAAQASG